MPQQNGGNSGAGGGGIGGGPLASIFSGLYGLFGKDPYREAYHAYQPYNQQAQGYHQPFYNAGQQGLGQYQNMLNNMSDPSKFINGLMGQYQESPFAHYQQQQGMRAAQNVGSASGLTGSTPLMQQAQQNAQNISSQDQNQWLQNVLGVNNQALGGYQNLANMGQNAGNSLSDLLNQLGQSRGGAKFGSAANRNQNWNNIIGGYGASLDEGADFLKSLMGLIGGAG